MAIPAKEALADEIPRLADCLVDSTHRSEAAPQPTTKMPATARAFALTTRARCSVRDRGERIAAR